MNDDKFRFLRYAFLIALLVTIVFSVGQCIRVEIKDAEVRRNFRAMPLPIRETDVIEAVTESRYRPTRWYVRDEYGVRYVVQRHARKAPTRRLLDVGE